MMKVSSENQKEFGHNIQKSKDMANGTVKTVIFMLFLLFIVSESRIMTKEETATLNCETVHGVVKGETCFLVAQQSQLDLDEFAAINPNVDCAHLFVGQWLCVAASKQ
ncbi:hypothetical protein K2173_023983 [Erythroxylum novogranatense]|uniref:LysM domain-containing protein n=1 Tax=Erythroxylum novogranatense TaxID=1862640 RepID=A0AAV8TQP1_9ROSI|nr:hypothetical protein K2173_023983 [Erythroxylum novogranatense]